MAPCTSCNTLVPPPERRYTGPDGYSTLCASCSWQYRTLRLPLFRTHDKITARRLPAVDGVCHVGFQHRGKHQDLLRPIVTMKETKLCLRCQKQKRTKPGPDGTDTLCEECYQVYRSGGMKVWGGSGWWSVQKRDGVWGRVVNFEGEVPVVKVQGWEE